MLLNLPIHAKAAISIGVFCLVGGTVAVTYNIFTTSTLEEVIKSRDFVFLTINDSDDWKAILEDYTKEIKTKEKLKINNFEGGGEEQISEFEKQCKSLLNIKYRVALSNGIAGQILWCVKQQTVEDYLTKNKYTVLKTDSTESQNDNTKWDAKIKEYLKLPKGDKKNKFPELTLENSKENDINSEERTKFIDACKKVNKIKHFKEDFIKSYHLAAEWCAEKKEADTK